MKPVRIQLRRTKGWRMPPDTVKVDRSTRWGNPFRVGEPYVPTAGAAVHMFRFRLIGPLAQPLPPESRMGWIQANAGQLRGKNLACWCAPDQPCHADVLLELANG
jgi:hypothetical protein